MIRYVLFDLDGTLLPMDQDAYVEKYMKGLAMYYAGLGMDPKKVGDGLLKGVIASMKNRSEKTNEEIFWENFVEVTGTDLRNDPAPLYRFYAEIHPTLCSAVDQGRNSRVPVEILKEKGYTVALATMPVFPVMATRQRMSWAGLTPDDFALVTTFENSRRCKPNPEYFLEVAAKLGADPSECLMVGNDTRDDMAAAQAGMETYLVTDYLICREPEGFSSWRHGTFAKLIGFLESLPRIR